MDQKFKTSLLLAVTILGSLLFILSLPGCLASAGKASAEENPAVTAEPSSTASKTPPVPVEPPAPLRALWVWDAGVITDSAKQKQFLDFCHSQKISLIYLDVGDCFMDEGGGAKVPVSEEALAMFVHAAHAGKMKVHALDGDASWVYQENHSIPLERLQRALDRNLSVEPEGRLDGFQFDIEPYLLPEFKTDEWKDVLVKYLELVSQMRDKVKGSNPNFELGFAIPFWWDVENTQVSEVGWQGVKKPVAYHLVDTLNGLQKGYIAIMDYRDFTDGPDGSIRHASDEMKYVSENAPNVTVFIGQETGDVPTEPPKITFAQEGAAALEKAIAQLHNAFKEYKCFGGVAIHHYEGYQSLLVGDKMQAQPAERKKGSLTGGKEFTLISPKEKDTVARITTVSGTGQAGYKVSLSVFPYNDTWYPQQEEAVISDDGTWELDCIIGNDRTPKGYKFKIRAFLKDEQGKEMSRAELDYVQRE